MMLAGCNNLNCFIGSFILYNDFFRSTFLDAGFNADDYSQELEDLKKVHKPEPVKQPGYNDF